jgi:intracellular septation protein
MSKTAFLFGLEILPIIVFFIVGQSAPFSVATAVYMVTTVSTMFLIWYITNRVSYVALIFGSVILSAGSLSIWFDNPDIFLFADTVYYLGSALTLALLRLNKYNLMQLLFKNTFGITAQGWDILLLRWILALVVVGLANETVRQLGSVSDWFIFQIIKTVLILLFATYQLRLSRKHRIPAETNAWGIRLT